MIRILIADDHAILRRGLSEILLRELGAVTCGEAESAAQVVSEVERQDWDLVILDLTMPGPSGLEVLRTLKVKRPKLPILVLSMHAEDQYAKRVLKAGAAGYMNKESAAEELIDAIKRVLRGGRYISARLAERLAVELERTSTGAPHDTLSDREFEVMRLIGSGKTVGEIADLLALSDNTVSTYRARILEKMQLRTNAELIRYVVENRLLQ
jgi:two-component system, NarL family, invasion response regulator UvrY